MTTAFSLILQNEYFSQSQRKKLEHIKWPIVMKDLKYEQVKEVQQVLYSHYKHPASLSILYQFLYSNVVNAKEKFSGLQKIRENIFTSEEEKENGMVRFSNAQKVYYMFTKLANIFRMKNMPVRNTENMLMEPIDMSMKHVFCVVENGGKYLFSLTDLVNIFKMALLNMEFFVISPNSVKNPYTNNSFNKSTLLNMYFFLKNNLICIPDYIEKFFKCNFNIRLFLRLHKSWLQDNALENYVKTAHHTQLKNAITSMLYDYNMDNQRFALRIHHKFPEKELCQIMRPYLILYYKSRYSTDNTLLWHYKFLFRERMKKFYKFNKHFGALLTRRVANLKCNKKKETNNKQKENTTKTYRNDSYHAKDYLPYRFNNHYENTSLYMISHLSNNEFENAPDDVNEYSRETIGTDAQDTDEYEYDNDDSSEILLRPISSTSNQSFREMAQQYNIQRNPNYRGGNTEGNSQPRSQQGSRVANNVIRRLTRRRDDDDSPIFPSNTHPRFDPVTIQSTPRPNLTQDHSEGEIEDDSDDEIMDPMPGILFGPREANSTTENQNTTQNVTESQESESTAMSIETNITENHDSESSGEVLTPLTSPDDNAGATDINRSLANSDYDSFFED